MREYFGISKPHVWWEMLESPSVPNIPLVSNHHSCHTNQSIILWHRTNYKIKLDDTHTYARREYAVLTQRHTTNSAQKPCSHICLFLCLNYKQTTQNV